MCASLWVWERPWLPGSRQLMTSSLKGGQKGWGYCKEEGVCEETRTPHYVPSIALGEGFSGKYGGRFLRGRIMGWNGALRNEEKEKGPPWKEDH